MSRNWPRVGSPSPGFSILITSAPNHARICVQVGPDWTCVMSKTRTPSKAFPMFSLVSETRLENDPQKRTEFYPFNRLFENPLARAPPGCRRRSVLEFVFSTCHITLRHTHICRRQRIKDEQPVVSACFLIDLDGDDREPAILLDAIRQSHSGCE